MNVFEAAERLIKLSIIYVFLTRFEPDRVDYTNHY